MSALFDQYTAMLALLNYVCSNADLTSSFAALWEARVKRNFADKYAHFVTSENSEAIIVRNMVRQRPKEWKRNDVSGWILFPVVLGLRYLPDHMIIGRVFPQKDQNPFTYAYAEGVSMSLKLPLESEEPWVILPMSAITNEGLMGSFFETVISFKYFVFFLKGAAGLLKSSFNEQNKVTLRKKVINAIVAGSPFFYCHDYTVLKFLDTHLPMPVDRPFPKEYTQALHLLAIATPTIPHRALCDHFQEQIRIIEDFKAFQFECCSTETRPFFTSSSSCSRKLETQ